MTSRQPLLLLTWSSSGKLTTVAFYSPYRGRYVMRNMSSSIGVKHSRELIKCGFRCFTWKWEPPGRNVGDTESTLSNRKWAASIEHYSAFGNTDFSHHLFRPSFKLMCVLTVYYFTSVHAHGLNGHAINGFTSSKQSNWMHRIYLHHGISTGYWLNSGWRVITLESAYWIKPSCEFYPTTAIQLNGSFKQVAQTYLPWSYYHLEISRRN